MPVPPGVACSAARSSGWSASPANRPARPVCCIAPASTPICYPYLFETPPDPAAGKLRKYPAAPHPFVLRPGPGGAHAAGDPVSVDVALFGHGNRHLPYVLHALDQAGRRGLGQGDGRLELTQVT